MDLRPELTPPILDEEKVARLARLAARLDGARPGQCDEDLEQFNREAGTTFDYPDFQKIYCSMDHDDWVRSVLVEEGVTVIPDITPAELLELISRSGEGQEHECWFRLRLLEVNLDPGITDLIFSPQDGPELSPKEILDIALTAWKKQPSGESPA